MDRELAVLPITLIIAVWQPRDLVQRAHCAIILPPYVWEGNGFYVKRRRCMRIFIIESGNVHTCVM